MGTTGRQFQVGDRVIYALNAYGDYSNNPVYGGSQGKIAGTIRDIQDNGWIRVNLDNGGSNTYESHTLKLLEEVEASSKPRFKEGDMVTLEYSVSDSEEVKLYAGQSVQIVGECGCRGGECDGYEVVASDGKTFSVMKENVKPLTVGDFGVPLTSGGKSLTISSEDGPCRLVDGSVTSSCTVPELTPTEKFYRGLCDFYRELDKDKFLQASRRVEGADIITVYKEVKKEFNGKSNIN